ncbi:AAA family ATPase [Leptospirillum ferriphilum]|uniref:AAA+ ATPase domain-containing protein n=1 Tax=Leptospirillum ferriphilum (strain ML-04) TaxID=1048260 RepID=J9Z9A6_LEPFM|nr:AAA family ATPase [Leptospirillum ferriphilum]AFS53110.1 hypothetical protein LFML04_0878 [Leptospirillum ferriphilum ML-04]
MDAKKAAPPDGQINQHVDFRMAEQFLQALDSTGLFTFQTFGDAKKDPALVRTLSGTFEQYRGELARLNQDGAGIFVTVARTDGQGRKRENITGVRAVFADFDGAPLPDEWPLEPHLIIESSPERWHVYWFVEAGFPLDFFEPIQKSIADRFGSDPAVCDLPRVMRIPGFLHKKGMPFRSRVIRDWSCEPRYSPDDILRAFPGISGGKKASPPTTEDPVLKKLTEKGMVIRQDRQERGKFIVRCPWADQHSNKDPEAGYWSPHHNGFKGPGFKCLHSHCAERTAKDLLEWLGIQGKAKADEGSFDLVRVSDLWDSQDEETDWVVENLLPEGSVGILGSRPKTGKSTFARCLAVSVASGRPFLNELEVIQGDVLYLALEENRRAVVRAFKTVTMRGFGMTEEEARETLSHVGLIYGQTPKDFHKKLTDLVETHQPKLIVVDTLIRLLKLQDSNAYSETSAGLEPLLHLAHARNVTVLLLHHTKKSDQGDLLGSTGIAASADVVITLGKKDGTRTLQAEGRGVSFEATTLTFDPSGLVYSLGVPVEEAEIQVMAERIREFIGTRDTGNGVFWKDIQSGVEGRKKTKNEAIKKLEIGGTIKRRGTPHSKKDPLRFILVPLVPPNTEEPRYQDTKNGSNPSQILVPEDVGSQGMGDNSGNQHEEIEWEEVD